MTPPVSRSFLQSVKQRVMDVYKEQQPLETLENVQVTILKETEQNNESRAPQKDEQRVATFFAFPL